jgi:hypothetical protein
MAMAVTVRMVVVMVMAAIGSSARDTGVFLQFPYPSSV